MGIPNLLTLKNRAMTSLMSAGHRKKGKRDIRGLYQVITAALVMRVRYDIRPWYPTGRVGADQEEKFEDSVGT